MIKSMTGYGRSEGEQNNIYYVVELRSVNHRFCEISTRLQKVFVPLENKIKKMIQSRFSRGRIDVTISANGLNGENKRLQINKELAKQYCSLLNELKREFGLKGDIEIGTLTQFHDIITIAEEDKMPVTIEGGLDELLIEAIDNLKKMRVEEGKILHRDILKRLIIIKESLKSIDKRSPEVVKRYRNRLKARIEELTGNEIDENRLLQEIVIYTDRSDISEEIVRLESHIIQFENIIEMDKAVGRSLEFLLQEMNREINTIGSKANDDIVSQGVVTVKNELERLREQVQNIE